MSARARSACPPEPTRPLDTDIHTPALCVFVLMLRMAVVAALLLILAAAKCSAQTMPAQYWLNLGGVSAHARAGMNNTNPALMIEARWSDTYAAMAGVLFNSQSHLSRVLALSVTPYSINTAIGPVHTGAFIGGVDGYDYRNGQAIPAGGLLAEWRGSSAGLSLVYVPQVSALRSSAVLTLMFKVLIP